MSQVLEVRRKQENRTWSETLQLSRGMTTALEIETVAKRKVMKAARPNIMIDKVVIVGADKLRSTLGEGVEDGVKPAVQTYFLWSQNASINKKSHVLNMFAC